MTIKSRSAITILLAIVLVLAMSASAFAAWSSFQKNNENNGIITTATPISAPTTTPITLLQNGTPFVGISTTPVINGYRSYTLYNGGEVSGTDGGARLAAVNASGTPSSIWSKQLNANANNVQQLSTPYLHTNDNSLFALTTAYDDQLEGVEVTDWKDSNGDPLEGPDFDFPVGTTTIYYEGLEVPSDYWQPQLATDINSPGADISGTVTLSDGTTTYGWGNSDYFGGDFTLYNNSGNLIPEGTYKLSLTITTDTAATADSIQFLVSNWTLHRVTNLTDDTVGNVVVTDLEHGYGQANTPVEYAGGYLYFGIYEGDRSYYQYEVGEEELRAFKPVSDDFYWAGATVVNTAGANYAVFGSDSGTLYYTPVNLFGVTYGGIDLTNSNFSSSVEGIATAGAIRSTICVNGGNLYFTSRGDTGASGKGYAWRATISSLTGHAPDIDRVDLSSNANSTSTPVVSTNGYIYVGGYKSFTSGSVQAVSVAGFDAASTMPITVYSGDPVQSSVIVYSTSGGGNNDDYVYFTTNTGTGTGYCYRYRVGVGSTLRWNVAGSQYALQGMASESGYLVFGNDANTLYVMK